MEYIIEIKNLVKTYGENRAVDNLSLKVKKGDLFAFLGVNGAGKSTTINIMCGILSHDSGSVLISGKEVSENKREISKDIGVVFQNSVLDSSLSVKDNLMVRASLYGMSKQEIDDKIKELATLLEFEKYINQPVGKLSGGQRRRIDVARALLHSPKILILDEPTTGLDPHTRKNLWQVINNLRMANGMTVFLTTHYMEEAADADYVVILDSGKIAAEGTPIRLKTKYTGDFLTIYGVSEEEVAKLNLPYDVIGEGIRVQVKDTAEARDLILQHPQIFEDFELVKGTMDDVFLNVTGKKLGGQN